MLGTGLTFTAGQNSWLPDNAAWGADFNLGQYFLDSQFVPFQTFTSFTRNSEGTYLDGSKNLSHFNADEPRIGDRGILLESSSSNLSLGSDLTGANIGIVGNGGALPSYWAYSGIQTVEITDLAPENGFDTIALRLVLGATSARLRFVDVANDIAATPLDLITHSIFIKNIGETGGGLGRDRKHGILWYNSSKSFVSAALASMPSDVGSFGSQRHSVTSSAPPNTAYIVHEIFWNSGAAGEVVLALAAPQLELGPTATSTLNSTRDAETLTLNVANGIYTVDVVFSTGLVQTFSNQNIVGDQGWTVPLASLQENTIHRIIGY